MSKEEVLRKNIQEVFLKVKAGASTPVEDEMIKDWIHQLNETEDTTLTVSDIHEAKGKIWNGVTAELKISKPQTPKRWHFIYAAAALLLVTGLSYLYYLDRHASSNRQKLSYLEQDKDPGNTKAHVLLADGSLINIDEDHDQLLMQKAGIKIQKREDGTLTYKLVVKDQQDQEFKYNKIYTPKGGQFNIELADGTTVMLNAYSSLSYPTYFKENERSVELSGEAFFKVKKQSKNGVSVPFYVKTRNQTVEVLGTAFNIMAYDDDDFTSTTLIEGKVSVNLLNTNRKKILAPGEQSFVSNDNQQLRINTGMVESAIAWTDGNFLFEDSYLKDILRQISRWYDVDINLRDVPQTRYNIFISRNNKLSTILKMLEKTGNIKFRIINNTIEIIK